MKMQLNLSGEVVKKESHSLVGKQVFPIGKSTPDHRTPLELFYSLGQFDLDVAANSENALCEYYFDEEDNGLNQPWRANRVWCNPPYSDIAKWIKKGIHETLYQNNCEEVVYLLPARTCTRWFKEAWLHAKEISFIHGRLNFTGPNMSKDSKPSAPFPSVLITISSIDYYGMPPEVNLKSREGEILA